MNNPTVVVRSPKPWQEHTPTPERQQPAPYDPTIFEESQQPRQEGEPPLVSNMPAGHDYSQVVPNSGLTGNHSLYQYASGGRFYRQPEKTRAMAALLANSSILVAGEEGSGKTVLAQNIVEDLRQQGFKVAYLEPTTPKQFLVEMAEQFDVDTTDLNGKALTVDGLKKAITKHLLDNVVFLVVDDAHHLETKLRGWLKMLKRLGQPIMLIATDPPKTDIFLNTPALILEPLPEYAIRDLMEKTALDKGLNVGNHQFAKLHQQVGGNPALAIRVVEQEHLGLTTESGDRTRHYFDMTPLIFMMGVFFVMMRFLALGTNNPLLYVMTGMMGALFMGLGRLMYSLPKDSKRISG